MPTSRSLHSVASNVGSLRVRLGHPVDYIRIHDAHNADFRAIMLWSIVGRYSMAGEPRDLNLGRLFSAEYLYSFAVFGQAWALSKAASNSRGSGFYVIREKRLVHPTLGYVADRPKFVAVRSDDKSGVIGR